MQAQFDVIARRRPMQVFGKQALHLPAGKPRRIGEFAAVQRLFQIGLHLLDDLDELGMAHAEARGQRHALMVVAIADALVDELLGDRRGELVTVLLAR